MWPEKSETGARENPGLASITQPQGTVGNETDQFHVTSGRAEIASRLPADVLLIPVTILDPNNRRTTPAMYNHTPCPRCFGRHAFRGELGARRLPCGPLAILVDGEGR